MAIPGTFWTLSMVSRIYKAVVDGNLRSKSQVILVIYERLPMAKWGENKKGVTMYDQQRN